MPTRDTAWPNGTPCWIDYAAADKEAAQKFYADVLGWSYSGGEPEYGGYLTCETKGLGAAGMAERMDPSQAPAWTTYFATDDADAFAARVTEAGGSLIMPPMDVGPMGRMSIAADPEGNSFGLWQAGEHKGVGIYNEPGSLVWNEAAVKDIATTQAFYTNVFGFHFDEVEGGGGYATFATDDHMLGGFGPQMDGGFSGWATCFSVASADDAVAATTKAGGSVMMPPQDTPYGRFAVVQDPWGATFEVMQANAG